MRSLSTCMVVLVAAGAAHAKPGKPDCAMPAMRKVRAAADKAAKAKDYKAAIAALEGFRKACASVAMDPIESAWLAGDLAVAYWKDGQPVECVHLMEALTFPKSDVARSGGDKLTSALQYNLDQCEQAFDAQYAALTSPACPLTIEDASAAVALPASLAPKGATAACLALVPGDAIAGDEIACPAIAVVSQGRGGRIDRTLLTGGRGSPLVDPTFCCGLNQLAVGVKDGQTLVRVGGDTWIRECHGGTATSSLDTIFAWKGGALTTVVDASTLVW